MAANEEEITELLTNALSDLSLAKARIDELETRMRELEAQVNSIPSVYRY